MIPFIYKNGDKDYSDVTKTTRKIEIKRKNNNKNILCCKISDKRTTKNCTERKSIKLRITPHVKQNAMNQDHLKHQKEVI